MVINPYEKHNRRRSQCKLPYDRLRDLNVFAVAIVVVIIIVISSSSSSSSSRRSSSSSSSSN